MLILTIRTDQPNAEIGLYQDTEQIQVINWEAGRQLAETLNKKIQDLLDVNNKRLKDLEGIVCFKGPGSFTGLRIGLVVANTMAYALNLPIVGETSDDWAVNGVTKLQAGEDNQQVMPEYGASVHITPPKK